ncbi:637_t:CDS:2 [Dentiscutata heterogama]|uniref:637_t:CDS:1 n=1 Tax=Dentiscutata heterogama TaxID=1316150 RepID=A0ACA9L7Q7_9GLOM|nr:637_t:CDS:2 [Dentiscutata heterogama]
MKHNRDKCVDCGKNRKLKPNKLCIYCNSKQTKCTGCNKKVRLKYENNKLCTACYYTRRFLNFNSGNQDIDNLIKATHNKQLNYRLEWIPFKDFVDIKQIGTGGFSEVYTATWTKGTLDCTQINFNRFKNATVVLKVLKDSSNINSAFLKELQNIVESQPNSSIRRLVQCYGVSQEPDTNNYIFVMTYMSHGCLTEYLSNHFTNITWKMKQSLLRDIVKGIKWIHENKIIHRDIHSGNILIDKTVKYGSESSESFIADLGFKAENKRQELFNSGRFIVKHVHPHHKTHSKLLSPTIDLMLSSLGFSILDSVNSFQNSSNYSFNIM